MAEHPEERVIADIDALIDEQLARGPVDDYNVDRYDRCELCGGGWHGTPDGLCPGAWADDDAKVSYQRGGLVYTDTVAGIRLSGDPAALAQTQARWEAMGAWADADPDVLAAAGWVDLGHVEELVERPPGQGYTLAELHALRASSWRDRWGPGGPPTLHRYHHLRFWALAVAYGHGGGHRLQLAEIDRVQVQEATVTTDTVGGPITAALHCCVTHPAAITWTADPDPATAAPLQEVTPDRLNVELAQPSGAWEMLGYAPSEDGLQLQCDMVLPPVGHRGYAWDRWRLQFEVTIATSYTDTHQIALLL